MKFKSIFLFLMFLAGLYNYVIADEIALYPTGPSQDSSFVRFVNGTESVLEITAAESKNKIKLDSSRPSTNYYPVKAKSKISGKFIFSDTQSNIDLSVKPGEFATVIALPATNGKGLRQVIVREEPDDFNALKVSLSLYNLDSTCTLAGLNASGRAVSLFKQVAVGKMERRSINPVKISVDLLCDGKLVATPLNLGDLQAGQRYSIFVMPSSKGSRMFIATDTVAH